MSEFNSFKALSVGVTICIGALATAACTILLRGDESSSEATASIAQRTDLASAELERCRTISYEQQDELRECRKIWAEKRRQFLGQQGDVARDPARPDPEAMPPASLKNQSRLPTGLFPTPTQGEP
jgi:conjugative transfer region protein TrbK